MVKQLCSGVLLLAAIAGGQGQSAELPGGPVLAARQQLVRQLSDVPQTFDPVQATTPAEMQLVRELFEGLTNQDSHGNTVPGVAVSWSSNDNKHWIFTLRKNARWSDGRPVTAADFVANWQRLVDPATQSPNAEYAIQSGLANAAAIIRGELPPPALGVSIIDDSHLKVTLSRPLAYFPVMTSHTSLFPRPSSVKVNPELRTANHGQLTGNGAWQTTSLPGQSQIILTPNPQYYNHQYTRLTKVTYLLADDDADALRRFRQGSLDITAPLTGGPSRNLISGFPAQLVSSSRLGTWYLRFDTVRGPTVDVRVRKALSWSIDRETIAGNVLTHGERPAWHFTPDVTSGFTPPVLSVQQYSFRERVAQAKSLLTSAGYGPARPLVLTLRYRAEGSDKQVMQAIANMWQQQLNAVVTLRPRGSGPLAGDRVRSGAGIISATLQAETNHPAAFLNQLTSTHPENISGFSSPQYDALLQRAEHEPSELHRNEDYKQAEHLLAEQVPVVPVYQSATLRLIAPQVRGYPVNNPQDVSYSREMWIEQRPQ